MPKACIEISQTPELEAAVSAARQAKQAVQRIEQAIATLDGEKAEAMAAIATAAEAAAQAEVDALIESDDPPSSYFFARQNTSIEARRVEQISATRRGLETRLEAARAELARAARLLQVQQRDVVEQLDFQLTARLREAVAEVNEILRFAAAIRHGAGVNHFWLGTAASAKMLDPQNPTRSLLDFAGQDDPFAPKADAAELEQELREISELAQLANVAA